jgi:hypothetical protein
MRNKVTGERKARNNETGEKVCESTHPDEYAKIRKSVLNSTARKQKDELMKDFGLVKCKGAVSGKTYWE